MSKSGIYLITNNVNNKIYVGSAVDIDSRWRNHKSTLNKNKHHSNHLQRAWNKYGEENFKFEILEECKKENLIVKEQHWLDYHQSYKKENGYNISPSAKNCLGVKHTKEFCDKISKANKGKIVSEEYRKKISGPGNPMYGRKHSLETKEKIRNSKMGQFHSVETKRKISEAGIGKVVTEKTRFLLSMQRRGEKAYQALLTWEKVKEIREKYVPYVYTMIMLAEEYSVSKGCIQGIIENKKWKKEEIL